MKEKILAILFLFLFAVPILASDIYHDGISAKSKNGRFEVITTFSTSSDNPIEEYMEIKHNFTITFTDIQQKKMIWTHTQTKQEGNPVQLIPTDDGYLIMYNDFNEYCVFDKQGNQKMVFNILETFPENEKERFTINSTAGILWKQYSTQDFFTDGGKLYFYIRTYWGRLAVIDIKNRSRYQDTELIKKIEYSLVKKIKEWIKTFNNEYYSKCNSCKKNHIKEEITENVFVIKKYNLPEGNEILQEVIKKADDGRYYDIGRYLNLVDITPLPIQPGKNINPVIIIVVILIVVFIIYKTIRGNSVNGLPN